MKNDLADSFKALRTIADEIFDELEDADYVDEDVRASLQGIADDMVNQASEALTYLSV